MAKKYVVQPFDRSTFPALYRCADDASNSAQWWYIRWFAVNLGFLITGAVVGSMNFTDIEHKRIIQIIAAACFFLALGTTLLLAARRWERVWYSGRAVAESVKSLTWKFVSGADPFPVTLDPSDAAKRFTEALEELVHENKSIAAAFSGPNATDEQITADMNKLRESSVGVIRDVYLAQRVNQQQEWYANKSALNRSYRNIWFGFLVFFQAAAGIAAIVLAVFPAFPWRAAAVFSTLASATAAWGQVKRFQELAQAYGLAAQELSLISARGAHVRTREDIARFVNDAETAISREHSTWVARRETR